MHGVVKQTPVTVDKSCSCGKHFETIDLYIIDMGIWWDCDQCGSTIFILPPNWQALVTAQIEDDCKVA